MGAGAGSGCDIWVGLTTFGFVDMPAEADGIDGAAAPGGSCIKRCFSLRKDGITGTGGISNDVWGPLPAEVGLVASAGMDREEEGRESNPMVVWPALEGRFTGRSRRGRWEDVEEAEILWR